MSESPEEEPNELAIILEKQRRKWLSKIQQGGGGGCGSGCSKESYFYKKQFVELSHFLYGSSFNENNPGPRV